MTTSCFDGKEVLLQRVWSYDFDANVVEVYVKHLRQKLKPAGDPDAA